MTEPTPITDANAARREAKALLGEQIQLWLCSGPQEWREAYTTDEQWLLEEALDLLLERMRREAGPPRKTVLPPLNRASFQ